MKADATNLLEKEEELAKQRRRQATLQSQKAYVDEKLKSADEDRLLLLEAVQEGIFGISNVGSITFINKSALKLLGYEEGELLGMSATQLICPVQDSPDSITQSRLDTKALASEYKAAQAAFKGGGAFTDAGRGLGASLKRQLGAGALSTQEAVQAQKDINTLKNRVVYCEK